jgi:AcrR family transcriptional regulator
MGSKDRIERTKANIYKNILDAAMSIVKNEGIESLTIRKIADFIEYTPPIIYSYFLNKDAVLIELTKIGYNVLNSNIQKELMLVSDPKKRMEAMLMTYLTFGMEENELYQLMYTIGTGIEDVGKAFPALSIFIDMFREQLQLLVEKNNITEEIFQCNYLICIKTLVQQ